MITFVIEQDLAASGALERVLEGRASIASSSPRVVRRSNEAALDSGAQARHVDEGNPPSWQKDSDGPAARHWIWKRRWARIASKISHLNSAPWHRIRARPPRATPRRAITTAEAFLSRRILLPVRNATVDRLVPAFTLNAIWDEFEKRGMSRRELEGLSGVARPRRDDFASTFSEPQVFRLFGAAASLTTEDTLGLSVGRAISLASLHVVGHLILSSVSLRQAMELVAGAGPHWRDPVVEMLPNDRVRLGFYNDEKPTAGTRVKDQLVGVFLHDIVRHFLASPSEEVVVELGFASPADITAYQRAFPAGVRFGAQGTFVTFPATGLDHRRSGADPALTKRLLAVVHEHFGELETDREWTRRVQRALRTHTAPRLMEPGLLAKQLGVSPRGLWRRLTREGESFTRLLDEALYERARALLSRPGATCGRVAEELGYAELSSFNRAFHRWSGIAPSDYRKRMRATSDVPAAMREDVAVAEAND